MAKPTFFQSVLGRPSQSYHFPSDKNYHSSKSELMRAATEASSAPESRPQSYLTAPDSESGYFSSSSSPSRYSEARSSPRPVSSRRSSRRLSSETDEVRRLRYSVCSTHAVTSHGRFVGGFIELSANMPAAYQVSGYAVNPVDSVIALQRRRSL